MYPQRGNVGRKTALILRALVCLAVLALAACAGSYGSLKKSAETNREFESAEISNKYNYFYTGSYYKPNAIIGLLKEYTLVTKIWKAVDLTPERLSGWIYQMTDFRGYALANFGQNILDEQGQMIGVWYSWENFTTIRLLEDKKLWIYPPRDRPMFGGDEAKYKPKKKQPIKIAQHAEASDHLTRVNTWQKHEPF